METTEIEAPKPPSRRRVLFWVCLGLLLLAILLSYVVALVQDLHAANERTERQELTIETQREIINGQKDQLNELVEFVRDLEAEPSEGASEYEKAVRATLAQVDVLFNAICSNPDFTCQEAP